MRSAVSPGTANEAPYTLVIRFFGAPRFEYGKPLTNTLQPRALSALAYLLLHRGRDVVRDTMAFALWPDVTEEEARANLRRALYLLQHWLPEQPTPWFFADRRRVSWNEAAPYWLDVAEYETLAGQERLKEAVALFQGDLLEGVEDEWLAAERDRLRGMHLEMLHRLADQLAATGDAAGATECLQKALAIDPWREDFVRKLIRLRATSGDRAGALREYKLFEEALMREMGASPERETTEVFERIGKGDAVEAPPPLCGHAFENNLPAQLTNLIGREEEVGILKDTLERHRLVTIAGAGGIGKTRLAIQVGADLTEHYRDGVWLVEFAPISVEAFVPSTVAAALNIHESRERTLNQSVIQALSNRRALLIFDNCEHLVDAAARFADEVLRACPRVQIIVTSRQPLNAAGEHVYRVNPLPFPASSAELTASGAMQYSSITLFVERAQAVHDSFTLTDENVAAVADICRRLDGIALAIELAAARVRVLSPSRLNEGLRARFRLLTGGARTQLPRHQTLRALIDWSYALLDEREKLLLRRVAVFAGSFTLEGATAVYAAVDADELDVLDILSSLVEKSLVNAETGESTERYRLLESTRQYLTEVVDEADERERLLRLHAEYYRALALRTDHNFHRTPQSVWFRSVGDEYENLREVLLWALTDGKDAGIGATIAGSLRAYWFNCGRFREGLFWIEQALQAIDEGRNAFLSAKLYLAQAVLQWGTQKLQAADRAAVLFEAANEVQGLGYALRQRALALRTSRPEEAEEVCRRAANLLHEAGDSGGYAMALNTLGSILAKRGDFENASLTLEQALAAARVDGGDYATMQTLLYLSDNEFQRGNVEEAVTRAAELLDRAQSTRMPHLMLNARINLALYRIVLGQYAQAVDDLIAALALLTNVQDSYPTALVLQHVALVEAERGDAALAARLTGFVDAYFDKNQTEREATEKMARERLEKALRLHLLDSAYKKFYDAGTALSEQQAVEEAQGVRQVAA